MSIPRTIRPCKGCDAPIFFAHHYLKGNPIPFDADPVPGGGWWVRQNVAPICEPVGEQLDMLRADDVQYRCHLDVCPEAETWRWKADARDHVHAWSIKIHGPGQRHELCMRLVNQILADGDVDVPKAGTTEHARYETIRRIVDGYRPE